MTHVVCLLNVENDRATLTWSEGPASFEPYQIEGGLFQDFIETAQEARDKLSDLVKDYLLDEQNLPQSSLALAEAGHELYLQLFDPGAAQARSASEVRRWLENLSKLKSIDTLEIVVDSPWSLPWNVVYDQEPDRQAFLSDDKSSSEHWRPFWAIRYNLTGGRKVSPLRRMPLLQDPHVLLVIDPEIRDGLPDQQRQLLIDFIATHSFATAHSKQELTDELKAKRPQLLYWLSHATPSALVLGDEEITPRQLRRLLRHEQSNDPYEFGGIAFLNACQTVESAQGGSFFDALHSVGFSGMVGTEHQTVDTFANPLGLDFLNDFLLGGKPLGAVMRQLRARVPLGLLYGTYCPPDLCVENQKEGSQIRIVQTPVLAGAALDASGKRTAPPLPEEPYRSLAYYSYQDRALFAGRDDDIERFATLLDDAGTRIVVLHGESGVGKTSFLRAGVIPYLEEECVGYRFVRKHLDQQQSASEESALFVRATNDLAGSLAQTLTQFCSQSFSYQTPTQESVEVDLPRLLAEAAGTAEAAGLRDALLNDPGLAGRVLAEISNQLPFEPILVIDQCEEVFTLTQTPEDSDNRQLSIAMLRRMADSSGNFKVILSLRTEYYGRLIDGMRRGVLETNSIREYLLTDFDEPGLVEAIKRPTQRHLPTASQAPFEKYGFNYDSGVAEEIARRVAGFSAQRRDSVLPLLQVVCGQLHALTQRREQKQISLADLELVGGVEGGLRSHVETMIDEMFAENASDKKRFRELLAQLYIQQPDGSLTTALLPQNDVADRWQGKLPFAELIERSQQRRLLRVNTLRIGGQDEQRYVSLGHDALAKLAAEWNEELNRGARMRKLALTLAGVTGLAAILLALTITAMVGWNNAKKNRDRAETNLDSALQLTETYFTRVSNEKLLNKDGMQELRRTLLRDAIQTYSDLLTRRVQEDSKAVDDLTRMAEAYYRAGRLGVEMGMPNEAADQLAKSLKIQLDLAKKPGVDNALALSNTWTEIGNARTRIEEAKTNPEESKNWEGALDAYLEAETLRSELTKNSPDNPEYKRLLASVKMNMGFCQIQAGDSDAARDLLKNAQGLRQSALEYWKDEPERITDLNFDLGLGSYNLGKLEIGEKQYETAKPHFREAKESLKKVLDARADDLESSEMIGLCDRKLGDMEAFLKDGDIDLGIKLLGEAAGRLASLADANPSVRSYQSGAAGAYFNLGAAIWKRRDANSSTAAREAYENAISRYEKIADQGNAGKVQKKLDALLQ